MYTHTYIYIHMCASTPQLHFKTPQIPSNTDCKALNRGTLGCSPGPSRADLARRRRRANFFLGNAGFPLKGSFKGDIDS